MTLSPSGAAFCMTARVLECRKCGAAAGSGMTRIKDNLKNAKNEGANECHDREKEKRSEGQSRWRSQLFVLMHFDKADNSVFCLCDV